MARQVVVIADGGRRRASSAELLASADLQRRFLGIGTDVAPEGVPS